MEGEGYKISEATTGTQALEKIKAEKPDLIILDVMMPDMSGFEVCQIIREDPETVHLPIILYSALSDSKNENWGYETGADEYLTKTVEPGKIKTRVAALLNRAQKFNTPKK